MTESGNTQVGRVLAVSVLTAVRFKGATFWMRVFMLIKTSEEPAESPCLSPPLPPPRTPSTQKPEFHKEEKWGFLLLSERCPPSLERGTQRPVRLHVPLLGAGQLQPPLLPVWRKELCWASLQSPSIAVPVVLQKESPCL